jgi:hypothetical protein
MTRLDPPPAGPAGCPAPGASRWVVPRRGRGHTGTATPARRPAGAIPGYRPGPLLPPGPAVRRGRARSAAEPPAGRLPPPSGPGTQGRTRVRSEARISIVRRCSLARYLHARPPPPGPGRPDTGPARSGPSATGRPNHPRPPVGDQRHALVGRPPVVGREVPRPKLDPVDLPGRDGELPRPVPPPAGLAPGDGSCVRPALSVTSMCQPAAHRTPSGNLTRTRVPPRPPRLPPCVFGGHRTAEAATPSWR